MWVKSDKKPISVKADPEQYDSVDSDFVYVDTSGQSHKSFQPKLENALKNLRNKHFKCDEPPSDFLKKEKKPKEKDEFILVDPAEEEESSSKYRF